MMLPREVAFEWELTYEAIYFPLGCLQGGHGEVGQDRLDARRGVLRRDVNLPACDPGPTPKLTSAASDCHPPQHDQNVTFRTYASLHDSVIKS